MIEPALVERDDIGPQLRGVERFLFDGADDGSPGRGGLGGCHLRFHGGVHAIGHVDDLPQDVEFQIGAGEFLAPLAGEESIAIEIPLRCAEFLQGVRGDVVIGDDQTVLRNETRRNRRC